MMKVALCLLYWKVRRNEVRMCAVKKKHILHMLCPPPPKSHYNMVDVCALVDLGGKVEECTPYTVARSYVWLIKQVRYSTGFAQ